MNAKTPAASQPNAALAEQALLAVLNIVRRYLPPDGIIVKDAMSEIIACVDPWPLATSPAASQPTEPDAWLFICKKPGKTMRYASVDENDTYNWPMDEWKSVVKTPLYATSQPPAGFAMVPIKPTCEMEQVFDQEGWAWADVLAAACAITEQEYESTQPPAASQPSDEPFPGMSEAFEAQSDGWFLPRAKLNAPMLETLEKLIAHAKRARWTNATVRKDSVETVYEADWIKWLTPIAAAQVAPSQPSDAVDAARYRLLEGEAYECVVPHGNKVEGVRTAWITKLHAGSTFSDAIDRALAAKGKS